MCGITCFLDLSVFLLKQTGGDDRSRPVILTSTWSLHSLTFDHTTTYSVWGLCSDDSFGNHFNFANRSPPLSWGPREISGTQLFKPLEAIFGPWAFVMKVLPILGITSVSGAWKSHSALFLKESTILFLVPSLPSSRLFLSLGMQASGRKSD